ncbi:MAG: hypothetical protein HG422_03495 [Prevotella sp.]|jgi:hypothetical protein|nr:hypothetical protein [Prevotella sp.]
MEGIFRDEIELREVDKFFCNEMKRQIHRYIKAHGSMLLMQKFEESLAQLSVADQEEAVARYIDRNRRAVTEMDWRMLIARAMANYCDSYSYFLDMVGDEETMNFYVSRMKGKYLRFHSVTEKDGKYGLSDYKGREILSPCYDFIRTPYCFVDDMLLLPVIAEKGGKMGLVLPDGHDTVVVPFEYDDISLRDEEPWFELTQGNKVTYWPNKER